ncbi:uncharacterized protein DUF3592 [Murinocardiopsis flavida]|uniref:Uncharacterized protein DUF3592 n=1 Tax=Murinocardiopsis flavida TaxID=645275 RepID=A0A2P8DEQ0_9ACTN|nr:DUF3592 domain-containing protein [Murinocardiopsis flavida]PSK95706.1 uncharacterized protein DUF3592 [Murinocardiopsis flavida]
MSFGAVTALLVGIAMLIFPAWLAWNLIRRQRRLATWPRAQATIRHVWKTTRQSSATGTSTTEKTMHARYEFRDNPGRYHTGEVEHLAKPKVGDVLEVMYDPTDPKLNDTVSGGSVVGRIINYGAIFILLGGMGIFFIVASLDLVHM